MANRDSPAYISWRRMRQRIAHREDYRHLSIDPRWDDFQTFLRDMGERPSGMSLGRVDNSKGYSPENCRWETATQQCANRRSTPEYGPYIQKDKRGRHYKVVIPWLDVCRSFSSLQEAVAHRNSLLEPNHAATMTREERVL